MIKLDCTKPITYEQLENYKPLDIYADMRRLGLYPVGLPYRDGLDWVQDFVDIKEKRDE